MQERLNKEKGKEEEGGGGEGEGEKGTIGAVMTTEVGAVILMQFPCPRSLRSLSVIGRILKWICEEENRSARGF